VIWTTRVAACHTSHKRGDAIAQANFTRQIEEDGRAQETAREMRAITRRSALSEKSHERCLKMANTGAISDECNIPKLVDLSTKTVESPRNGANFAESRPTFGAG
jgi:hypothetical protein